MAKNLVVCFDGTNNQFGSENTNVVRLVQALNRDPHRQRLYYDPGVGTLPEPSAFTRLQKWLSKVYGLAVGGGLERKTGEAYAYLMEMWEPGDRVFLIGFSRGAYTARVLAGLLYTVGLLPRGNQNLVPYALRLFGSVRGTAAHNGSAYWDLCREFRRTFARQVAAGDYDRHFPVHFLGLWDTVSSVGWVWNPQTYPYTMSNPGVGVVRHAVSLDERRFFFRQNLVRPADGQDCREVWFPGVHADVGGGYPPTDGSLWRPPFEWMLDQAEGAGLEIDPQGKATVLTGSNATDPWNDQKHESLTWKWWPAELVPKLVRHGERGRRPTFGLWRGRRIRNPIELHESVLRRIQGPTGYAPPNLSAKFREDVRGLTTLPTTRTYTP